MKVEQMPLWGNEDELVESVEETQEQDIEEQVIPPKQRILITQPYDLGLSTLRDQVKHGQIYLRPLHDKPHFQRFYVWSNKLASRLVESILLNVPIPPCYFSQNEDFSYEVIDGQQRIYSLYRFFNNEYGLSSLEILKELNGKKFHQLDKKLQRQLETHILRCVVITNNSSPDIQFDVFERLNSNTMPLNAQELRNCMYRGDLNDLINELTEFKPWLGLFSKKHPDRRMRDAELILRYFAFHIKGIQDYKTPLKQWLNAVIKEGRRLSPETIDSYRDNWQSTIKKCLLIFSEKECFRRWPVDGKAVPNRALMDLVMYSFSKTPEDELVANKRAIREKYKELLMKNDEFDDLISKSVDHKSRTLRRFDIWKEHFSGLIRS